MSDILERLRSIDEAYGPWALMQDAIAEIKDLRAFNAELLVALERIAEAKSVLPQYEVAGAAIAKAKGET